MKTVKLMESQVPEITSRMINTDHELSLSAAVMDKIADVTFTAVSNLLKALKETNCPAVFVFDELNGDVIAAAIVEYHEAEDKSQPGNWSYVWTFDKADIPEGAKIYTISNQMTHPYFVSTAGSKYHFGYETDSYIAIIHNCFLKVLKKYLDDNATEGITIELDGIFQARAAVEDGEIVKSIEVVGETKALIKSDDDVEVK